MGLLRPVAELGSLHPSEASLIARALFLWEETISSFGLFLLSDMLAYVFVYLLKPSVQYRIQKC